MNILVKKEDLSDSTPLHGGEYAVVEVEIHVDAKLPLREQRIDVIHAVLENYFPSLPHVKIEVLTTLIEDALDQLEAE